MTDSRTTDARDAGMRLRELTFGAMAAAAVRAALRLDVPDTLGETPESAEDLAKRLNVDARSLRRLMRALVAHGVFAEQADGRFAHNDTSRLLRADTPRSMRHVSLWATEPWTWEVWPRLEDAVRHGGSVFPAVFGMEFFDYLHNAAPESAETFNRAMTQSSGQSAQDVAAVLDLADARVVADIGGGQGLLIATLLERHPHLRGALLDLPAVVADADPRLRRGGPLADRVTLVPGDCRDGVPVHADVYILKNILEWDDTSTRRTLGNLVEAAEPGTRVVVIENLVDESASLRFSTGMDLLLLLNVGGAKHTRESMVAAMTRAGLEIGDIRAISPTLHMFDSVVPARPAAASAGRSRTAKPEADPVG
ncbi:acetylserotonin O-methyltransferase [Yinghuangia sp. ASG 101]|uniref:acetylserotonin O-methyltransferase n=1 Tax=Yinghuangia sp. ASG 101 TaxID=2896848 RepID=UPI001E284A3C|nr:acetylserotonin O-methyltransferase [Yinghuangia sp. ASG 101]UGQ10789.1 acetylserotonin O-methyltransferase [Yinghuangia sp. ASG 101]